MIFMAAFLISPLGRVTLYGDDEGYRVDQACNSSHHLLKGGMRGVRQGCTRTAPARDRRFSPSRNSISKQKPISDEAGYG
ncbi:MAG: hypothetical protein EBU88_06510 [Acidobacteria bacterium]|nr:hypothetical protein [Acidobacteriota bacterium]